MKNNILSTNWLAVDTLMRFDRFINKSQKEA